MKTIPDYNAPRGFFSATSLWFAVGFVSILAQLVLGPAGPQTLDSIESFWARSLLTQFIHLGWIHLALNLAGLAILTWGFSHLLKPSQWTGLMGISLVWVALYIAFIEPLSWYCGLSGALHMQFVVCLALAFRQSAGIGLRAWPLWVMLLGLLAKLLLELDPATATDPSVGGPVAYAAHRGGALGGLLVFITLATRHAFKKFVRRV